MGVILLVLAFLFIVLLEVPGLVQRKQYRELVAFSVLLGMGFILSLLQVLGVRLPSPIDGIVYVTDRLTRAVSQMIK